MAPLPRPKARPLSILVLRQPHAGGPKTHTLVGTPPPGGCTLQAEVDRSTPGSSPRVVAPWPLPSGWAMSDDPRSLAARPPGAGGRRLPRLGRRRRPTTPSAGGRDPGGGHGPRPHPRPDRHGVCPLPSATAGCGACPHPCLGRRPERYGGQRRHPHSGVDWGPSRRPPGGSDRHRGHGRRPHHGGPRMRPSRRGFGRTDTPSRLRGFMGHRDRGLLRAPLRLAPDRRSPASSQAAWRALSSRRKVSPY